MCSGVTDGTVITVTVLDTVVGRWPQAEQFYQLGLPWLSNQSRVHVDGQCYSRRQCFIKALEIDDQHANAWASLSYRGGGRVGGQEYTEQQCVDRALEIDEHCMDQLRAGACN